MAEENKTNENASSKLSEFSILELHKDECKHSGHLEVSEHK